MSFITNSNRNANYPTSNNAVYSGSGRVPPMAPYMKASIAELEGEDITHLFVGRIAENNHSSQIIVPQVEYSSSRERLNNRNNHAFAKLQTVDEDKQSFDF